MTSPGPTVAKNNLAVIAARIRGRRTTKLFLQEKVSDELVLEAIELARWAPNHHLTEPWHFYLFGDASKRAATELIRTIVTENKSAEVAEFKARSAAAVPGWLLVTCRKSTNLLQQQEDYASCCCAIQNLTLYLSEAGVGSKWTTGAITRDQRFFDLLDIDADREFVVGLIWYGYVDKLPVQKRTAVAKILTELD